MITDFTTKRYTGIGGKGYECLGDENEARIFLWSIAKGGQRKRKQNSVLLYYHIKDSIQVFRLLLN